MKVNFIRVLTQFLFNNNIIILKAFNYNIIILINNTIKTFIRLNIILFNDIIKVFIKLNTILINNKLRHFEVIIEYSRSRNNK